MAEKYIRTQFCVIGTGVGGLSAAIRARENGIDDVIILEKMPRAGGCSPIFGMTLGINTPLHERYGLHLDVNRIFMEHMKVQNWNCNGKLVSRWFNTVGEVFAWLEGMGGHFDELIDSGNYGDDNFKMQVLTSGSNVGAEINRALMGRVEALGIKILLNTKAVELVKNDAGKVCAVLAEQDGGTLHVDADAVLVACGSICCNADMIRQYVPEERISMVDRIEAAMAHNTGDGQRMIWAVGGKIGQFSVLYFGPHQHPYSNACGLLARRPQSLNVNLDGERFCNESIVAAGGGYQWMTGNALNRQKKKIQYSLYDQKTIDTMIRDPQFYSAIEYTLALNDYESDAFVNRTGNCATGRDNSMRQDWLEKLQSELDKEAEAGRVFIADTIEELAKKIGCPAAALRETVNTYNQACRYGYDPEFAKESRYLMPVESGPFYAIRAWQGIDSIIGGISVNHKLQVLNEELDPIPGLYSAGIGAGEILGGSYGFPGSESSYSMTSGYIAGGEVARDILNSDRVKKEMA